MFSALYCRFWFSRAALKADNYDLFILSRENNFWEFMVSESSFSQFLKMFTDLTEGDSEDHRMQELDCVPL